MSAQKWRRSFFALLFIQSNSMIRNKNNRGAGVQLRRRRGASHSSSKSPIHIQQVLYLLVGMTFVAAMLLVGYLGNSSSGDDKKSILRRRFHKKLLPETDNSHNAIAQDIITALECDSLVSLMNQHNMDDALDDDDTSQEQEQAHRRLQQGGGGEMVDDFVDDPQEKGGAPPMDDDAYPLGGGDGGEQDYEPSVNARHFLCLVAGAKNLPSYIHQGAFSCPNALSSTTKRQALLEIWSSARTQMSLTLLKKTLELAHETPSTILNHPLHIWMPSQDSSLEFLQNVLNDEQKSSTIRNLPLTSSSKNSQLFIDVGSGLGMTTLAVALEYPNTNICSMEPASPSWLLQKLNLVCNLDDTERVDTILAGVGGGSSTTNTRKRRHHEGMAKVLWRPTQTRLTRTWTSSNETSLDDIELIIKLRSLKSILAEYAADYLNDDEVEITTTVLNLDCEGCEYNLVPSLSEKELSKFSTIIGTTGVHWGYIPLDKLPSSKRAETTHSRLCKYKDYARQCIECCAFGDMQVEEEGMTVAQVAGELCNGFDTFAEDKLLFTSNDDFGWMELTSKSDMEKYMRM